MTETLSVILSSTSTVLSGTLTGAIACRSKLSGMPDLVLSFGDPSLLDDMAAHACVRSGRWKKDKVISFVPRAYLRLFNPHWLTLDRLRS